MGQIGYFSDHISAHFGSGSQNVRKSDLKKSRIFPFGPKLAIHAPRLDSGSSKPIACFSPVKLVDIENHSDTCSVLCRKKVDWYDGRNQKIYWCFHRDHTKLTRNAVFEKIAWGLRSMMRKWGKSSWLLPSGPTGVQAFQNDLFEIHSLSAIIKYIY